MHYQKLLGRFPPPPPPPVCNPKIQGFFPQPISVFQQAAISKPCNQPTDFYHPGKSEEKLATLVFISPLFSCKSHFAHYQKKWHQSTCLPATFEGCPSLWEIGTEYLPGLASQIGAPFVFSFTHFPSLVQRAKSSDVLCQRGSRNGNAFDPMATRDSIPSLGTGQTGDAFSKMSSKSVKMVEIYLLFPGLQRRGGWEAASL